MLLERTLACASTAAYRGTSLIRTCHPLGRYSRTMPRVLWGSQGVERFLMSEVPLFLHPSKRERQRGARVPAAASFTRFFSSVMTLEHVVRVVLPLNLISAISAGT